MISTCVWVLLLVIFFVCAFFFILQVRRDYFTVSDCDTLHRKTSQLPSQLPPTQRFIVFEIDCGGFNNIRMQLEVLVGLAKLTNRTLILPPKTKWYLLGPQEFLIGDAWDLSSIGSFVPILTYDKWIGKQLPYGEFFGNLRDGKYGTYEEPEWAPYAVTKYKGSQSDKEILYFYCFRGKKYEKTHRMFGNISCYFGDKDLVYNIRNSMRYCDKYYDTAKRVLGEMGLVVGGYNAVHVRIWETTQYRISESKMIVDSIGGLPSDIPILVLSKEPLDNRKEDLTRVPGRYRYVYPPKYTNNLLENAIVDMLLAIGANKFIGSPLSTYSTGIMEGRILYSKICDKIDATPQFFDGRDRSKCGPHTNFDKIIMF